MNKIDCSKIVLGACFSEPVYFDDGKNMFLSAGHPAKNYHLAAIKRWNVPYLLSDGKLLEVSKEVKQDDSFGHIEGCDELEELEEL